MKSGGPMFCALHFQSSVQCTNINFFTSFGFCLPKADRLYHKGETTCSLKKLRDRKTLQHNAVRNHPQQLRITLTLKLDSSLQSNMVAHCSIHVLFQMNPKIIVWEGRLHIRNYSLNLFTDINYWFHLKRFSPVTLLEAPFPILEYPLEFLRKT